MEKLKTWKKILEKGESAIGEREKFIVM